MRLVTGWLWVDGTISARMARWALWPATLAYRGVAASRQVAHAAGLRPRSTPDLPTVAVGNLTVGGAGKTPIASWLAAYYARRGVRPGIVLRGYGGDEGRVHGRLVPEAIVVENPDRVAGIREAAIQGARVAVLDDAFQRLDVERDLDLAVVSAESAQAPQWRLPAGPWRETWGALRRADLIVITRKRVARAGADAVAARIREVARNADLAFATLELTGFRGLRTDRRLTLDALAGARIVTAAGVADPATFAIQCRRLGAEVAASLPWRDHHRIRERDVADLLHAGRAVDYVVVTEKDAVKLRPLWPQRTPEPLVANLGVRWEGGEEILAAALDAVVSEVDHVRRRRHRRRGRRERK